MCMKEPLAAFSVLSSSALFHPVAPFDTEVIRAVIQTLFNQEVSQLLSVELAAMYWKISI